MPRRCACLSPSRVIVVLALLALLLGAPGCALDVFHDTISTRIELTVPPGVDLEPVSASKRFRFERDVAGARSAFIDHAWAEVDPNASVDLSALSRVEVYAIDPQTQARTLIVIGQGFEPGDTLKQLTLIYDGDVRGFVDDQRVTLEWEITPNRFFSGWDEGTVAAFGFGVVLEIDTE